MKDLGAAVNLTLLGSEATKIYLALKHLLEVFDV